MMKDLNQEIRETHREIEAITYEIRVNKTNPKLITELQAKRAPLTVKLNRLLEQDDKQKKENLANRGEKSIKAEIMFWVVEANGIPLQLDNDLSFTFTYPCGHKEKLRLSDLIPYTRDALYRDIKNGHVRLCQKCRAERKRKLAQEHMYTVKPTPKIIWKIRYRV